MGISLRNRRHFPLWVLLTLVLAISLLGLGTQRIKAYTFPGGDVELQEAASEAGGGMDISNSTALFDDSLVHTLQIIVSDEDYQEMITTYQQTGEKSYVHADIVIDGVLISDVGLRLKGNASLSTALGGRMNMGQAGDRQGWGQFNPEDMPDLQNLPDFQPGERPEMPQGEMPDLEAMPQPEDGAGFLPGGGIQTDPDGSAKIPLMIKFDEFVSGQTYQGYTAIAIRTYGTSYDAAMLQEPVTNSMARLAGIPATQAVYAGVQLNEEPEELFVISELVNQEYLNEIFSYSDGVLYKAELGSTLTYQGEDPSAYTESFTQQTRVNDADLAPLIRFMKFLQESTDEEFEAQLPDYLDVDAFAAYLAVNDLLVNSDSMIGMNNNYYLYYDDTAERFTVLMWDGNESLGKLSRGGASAEFALDFTASQTQTAAQDAQGQQADPFAARGRGGFGGPGGGTNALLERFMTNAAFKALYEDKLVEVYQAVFASGAIDSQIQNYADVVQLALTSRDLVDPAAYETAVASVQDFVSRRAAYLASTPLLSSE